MDWAMMMKTSSLMLLIWLVSGKGGNKRKLPFKHSINFCFELLKRTKRCVEAVLPSCRVITIKILSLKLMMIIVRMLRIQCFTDQ